MDLSRAQMYCTNIQITALITLGATRERERERERETQTGRQADRERQRETETGGLKGAERETADTALFKKKKKKFFVWMRGVRWFYIKWCLRQRDCGLFCPG